MNGTSPALARELFSPNNKNPLFICSLSSLFDFALFSERTSPLIDLAGAGKGVLHGNDRNPFQGGLTATDVFAVEWIQTGVIHFGMTVSYFGFVSDVLELSEKYQKRFGPLRYLVAGFLVLMLAKVQL